MANSSTSSLQGVIPLPVEDLKRRGLPLDLAHPTAWRAIPSKDDTCGRPTSWRRCRRALPSMASS